MAYADHHLYNVHIIHCALHHALSMALFNAYFYHKPTNTICSMVVHAKDRTLRTNTKVEPSTTLPMTTTAALLTNKKHSARASKNTLTEGDHIDQTERPYYEQRTH